VFVASVTSAADLEQGFASNRYYYTVHLPINQTVTVIPSVSASTGSYFSIDRAGPTALASGTTTLFTITAWPEDPTKPAATYIVNVTVAPLNNTIIQAFPCMGLIGTLGQVGYWYGDDYLAGLFSPFGCILKVKNAINDNGAPWKYRSFPSTLSIRSDYLASGLFFGILVAGGVPTILPTTPPTPAVPPTIFSATYTDQNGLISPIALQGGVFNFPVPGLNGNCYININATSDWTAYGGPGAYFTSNYPITIVLQSNTDVRNLNTLGGSVSIQAVKIGVFAPLSPDLFGQFVITTSTLLGGIFKPWRMLVISSGFDDEFQGNVIVVGFFDQQDYTRVSPEHSNVLAGDFAAAVQGNKSSNILTQKLQQLPSSMAIDFSVVPELYSVFSVTQVSPCSHGLWYLIGNIPVAQRQCGSIPDDSASNDDSNKKYQTANGLVSLFVIISCGIVIVGFIYYKWIAKPSVHGTAHHNKELELHDTNVPVAVPAMQMPIVAETATETATETAPLKQSSSDVPL